tara:strand:- start:4706 stop:5242 length:537 start_codon:yes stop_codon:yes gene_type:complete
MKINHTPLEGVLVVEPEKYKDERGYFSETFSRKDYDDLGIINKFVQDNHSFSKKGVLRGLHFQKKNPQGKLVRCASGSVLDVVVDINVESKTLGEHFSIVLSAENSKQLWIPPGYAHGFLVISDFADFMYKCTEYFHPDDQCGIVWDDPILNIKWPEENPIISIKDKSLQSFEDFLKT